MATCARCKQSHFGMFEIKGGFCKQCLKDVDKEEGERKVAQASVSNNADIQRITLTTEATSALQIEARLGIISAECAFGLNIFKDMFAGVRDVVGGRSKAVQLALKDSRRVVLEELRAEAFELGADAVVAIDFEYVDLSSSGNMILLVANGTAVKLRDET